MPEPVKPQPKPQSAPLHVQPFELTTPSGHTLAGEWVDRGGPEFVILSHGFGSDRHSAGRFDRLVQAYADLGISTARYDFTGFGASSDVPVDFSRYPEELDAVIDFVVATGAERIVLQGHSLGTAISLIVGPSHPQVVGYALTGALLGRSRSATDTSAPNPGNLLTDEESARLQAGETVDVRDRNASSRESFALTKEGIADPFGGRSQQDAVQRLNAPVLAVNGDADVIEGQLRQIAAEALPLLPVGSQVVTIHGADHSFLNVYDDVITLTTRWSLDRLRSRSR